MISEPAVEPSVLSVEGAILLHVDVSYPLRGHRLEDVEAGSREDQEFLRDAARKFLDAEVPLTAVRELAASDDGFDRAWWKRGAELGWTSMLVPEELGGGSLGGGLADLAVVAESMGRMVSPGPLAPCNVVASALAAHGSDAQRDGLLPPILAGELVAAWAFLESGAEFGTEGPVLVATPAEGGFTLRGTKAPVEAGAQADQLLVTARAPAGATQFLVPADAAGLTRTPMEGLDLVRRFASIRFDDVFVSHHACVGEPGGAAEAIERQLQIVLALQCAETAGAMAASFETTLAYMFDRFSFGRPLASYQALKHRFADMKLWVEACAAMAEAAARAVEVGAPDAAIVTSAAKSYVGDHGVLVIQECIQMHGGMGVTFEHDAHLYLRRATQHRALFGTPAEHRELVAGLLGLDAAAAA